MEQKYRHENFELQAGEWEFLPFRFHRFEDQRVLVTNMVGEHLFLNPAEFEQFTQKQTVDAPTLRRLRGKHILRRREEDLPLELLGMKTRTRYHRLAESTSLHIFVVTLRCEHACRYCQVSRQNSDRDQFDMTLETATPFARARLHVPVGHNQDRIPRRRTTPQLSSRRAIVARRAEDERESGKAVVVRDRYQPCAP